MFTNYFHNAIGILVGVWGIAAFTSLSGAIVFNRIFAILYAAGVILGLLPFTNTLFGLTPLFGNNIWLNAITAAITFYYGSADGEQSDKGCVNLHNNPDAPDSNAQGTLPDTDPIGLPINSDVNHQE